MIVGYPRGEAGPDEEKDKSRSSQASALWDKKELWKGGLGALTGWMAAVSKEEKERERERENRRPVLMHLEKEPQDILEKLISGPAKVMNETKTNLPVRSSSCNSGHPIGSSALPSLPMVQSSSTHPAKLRLDKDGLALLRGLLCMNPAHRWTPRMALESDFFNKGSQDFRKSMKVTWNNEIGTVSMSEGGAG